jgi:hypothetical protein
VQPVGDEHRRHQNQNHRQNERRVAPARRLHFLAGEPLRLRDVAAKQKNRRRHENQRAENVLQKRERAIARQKRQRRMFVKALQRDLHRGDGQNAEAPKHGDVQRARPPVAHDFRLRESDGEQVANALTEVVQAVFRLADLDVLNNPPRVEAEISNRGEEKRDEDEVFEVHPTRGSNSGLRMNDGSFRTAGEIPRGAHGVLLGTSVTDQKREKVRKRLLGAFEESQTRRLYLA